METTSIYRLGAQPGLRFAACELRKYLSRATGASLRVRERKRYSADSPAFWLGLATGFPGVRADEAADSADADSIWIDVGPAGGVIAGSNPRSVLLAVYRYLTELGCRWIRPGKDGEFVPTLEGELPAVRVGETASYRHRGICIEGAVSYEHVRDTIDWSAKLGMNAYFIQFREAYNFFQRWYEHVGNPHLPKRLFSVEKARELTARVRKDVKARDLELHMVGHGWTCEPFGIPGPGWFQHKGDLPVDAVQHLAEIKGKRELWHGIALNTNLCYGNPETRETIIDSIVDWAGENPDVDIIHFWLADGSNNHCECPLCRDRQPADLYVRMLNRLDEKLTAAGIDTRIVFLIYVDLLWPPMTERIVNQSRFILMFAPITRSYSSAFSCAGVESAEVPVYERNKLTFPKDPAVNVAFLRKWQDGFGGESFDFDYHFMWDHFKDPGYYAMAEVLQEDIRRLRDIGLDGFVSCQVQRAFFPTGLGMTAMARTLWNRDLTFKEIAADYFASAFGRGADRAHAYFRGISEVIDARLLRGEGSDEMKKAAPERLERVDMIVADIRPLIEKGKASGVSCHAKSWEYLELHTELCLMLSAALAASYRGEADDARSLAWSLIEWVRAHEMALQHVLDVFEFQWTVGPILGIPRSELEKR